MKYYLFSEISCVIKIKDNNYHLDCTNYIELESESGEIIYAYPIEKGYLPQIVNLSTSHYIFLDYQTISTGEVYLTKTFSSSKSAMLIGKPFKFYCQDNDFNGSFMIRRDIKDIEIKLIDNKIALCGNDDTNSYILIFNKGQFKEYIGFTNEEKQNSYILGKAFTVSRHGHILTLNNNQEELVYLNKKPKIPNLLQAKCFAFFQAIKLKDYNLARSFLHESLASKLTDSHFEDFFGDFEDVYYLGENKYILKSTKNLVLKIVIDNNKIIDIV